MRVVRLIIVFSGVILMFLMGCKEYVSKQYFNGDNTEDPVILSNNKPKKIYIFYSPHIDCVLLSDL